VAGLVAPRVFDREGEKQAMRQHVPDTAAANAALDTAREASRRDHLPYQVRHLDEIDWETIRWPGETGKMLFHPAPSSRPRTMPAPCGSRRARIIPSTITASGLVHPEGRVHDRRQAVSAGHDALPLRPAFRGGLPHRDRRRDPDRVVSRPVDRPIYAGRFNMDKRLKRSVWNFEAAGPAVPAPSARLLVEVGHCVALVAPSWRPSATTAHLNSGNPAHIRRIAGASPRNSPPSQPE
jgi:hypothetical protein